jgi:hypothetical protein
MLCYGIFSCAVKADMGHQPFMILSQELLPPSAIFQLNHGLRTRNTATRFSYVQIQNLIGLGRNIRILSKLAQ